MKLLNIKYKKEGQLLEREMRVLIDDDLSREEVREEVYRQILNDLGVSMFSWGIKESEVE